MDVPVVESSLYRGQVVIDLKEGTFELSSPARHCAELGNVLLLKILHTDPILFLTLTVAQTTISVSAKSIDRIVLLFLKFDLDFLYVENISKIWVRIPFLGKQGEYLVKKLIRKLQHNLTKLVKFIVIYQSKNVSYFLSKKDKIPDLERNYLVYEFSCSSCTATYIGKTVRNLLTGLAEHAKLNTSAVSEHLMTCEHARHIADLHNLYDNVH